MEIISKLRGRDLRSIGKVDEVVSDILADSSLFEIVFKGMGNCSNLWLTEAQLSSAELKNCSLN